MALLVTAGALMAAFLNSDGQEELQVRAHVGTGPLVVASAHPGQPMRVEFIGREGTQIGATVAHRDRGHGDCCAAADVQVVGPDGRILGRRTLTATANFPGARLPTNSGVRRCRRQRKPPFGALGRLTVWPQASQRCRAALGML